MDQTPNESFDQLTKIVARAGGISDDQAERIGSSPFLHARLRAGIDVERPGKRLAGDATGGVARDRGFGSRDDSCCDDVLVLKSKCLGERSPIKRER